MQRHTLFVREAPEGTRPADARRHGRVRCDQVESSLGTVLDISASGLRIGAGLRGYKPGRVVVLEVHTLDGAFIVQARVAWSRSTGLLSREVGLEFLGLDPDARRILLATVRNSRC